MTETKQLRTPEEIRLELARHGMTVATWARTHGFPVRAVQGVLRGQCKGRYGLSHDIAVTLGIKEGELREAAV